MKKAGLTLTVVAFAQSANYGEGFGNISTLKKLTRQNSEQYTYISRQALRYSAVEDMEWNQTPVEAQGSGDKQVVQFAPEATIADYPEIDLFGYMKTKEGSAATKRPAAVRLSDAISLEPFKGDLDFLTNMGLAARTGAKNAIAQNEQHLSYYTYTLTIDLDRIGIDGDIEIPNEEKANRVNAFLEEVEFLTRDIRGRRENLNPVFVVGGIYHRKNPFFKDRLSLKGNSLQIEAVKAIKESHDWINEQTLVGILPGTFDNTEEIVSELGAGSVADVFQTLEQKVCEYYGN